MRTTFVIQALVVLFIVGGFGLLVRDLLTDLEFQSFQAAEVVMVDTANILAAQVESASTGQDSLQTDGLAQTLAAANTRAFSARIFDHERTRVGMTVHATDRTGKVIYDSDAGRRVGQDFSPYRDVQRTLQGQYGARSTRTNPDDPRTSILHIAAPIRSGDQITGVLVVALPQADFFPFISARIKRTLWSATLIGSGVLVLALAVFFWLLRPIRRLTIYAQAIRDGKREPLPRLGKSREATTLGAAMEEMRAQLEGRAYAENYVQTLAHELKSPLAAIRGAGELLQEESMPPDQRARFLDNILRETNRSESLIRQLLELAKLEGRPALDSAEDVDMAELCRETVAAARPRTDSAGVSIVCKIPEAPPPKIQGDPIALRTALANLLENAISHSPGGGLITCALSTDGDEISLQVRDHGPGLPDFALDRAFDRFYSLPHPDTGRKGTGLGLAFVREAAHLHRGKAKLENHPEGGCLATLSLPLPALGERGSPRRSLRNRPPSSHKEP